MKPMQDNLWGALVDLTWSELLPYQWGDFRTVRFDVVTEQLTVPVAVENVPVTMIVETEMKTHGAVVEFSPVVNTAITEMIVNIVVSDRDYISQMIKCLPLYERKSNVINRVLHTYDREFRLAEQALHVVERNVFIGTSIETLWIDERDLGITTLSHLTYDQRREQIESRYRAAFDQTTEETIKDVASAYGNGEVEISETDVVGIYDIKFVGKGVPDNIEGLRQALNIIMPAHLGFNFVYSYNTWGELITLTWNSVTDETWSSVQVWEGDK
ncbi:YmfQ family protein [Streptococcus mutans]|nr:YmfQ family protein [Streptococcus mutans]